MTNTATATQTTTRTLAEIKAEIDIVRAAHREWEIVQNEGARDGYNPYDERADALLDEAEAAYLAEEFDRAGTIAKRERWNNTVRAMGAAATQMAVEKKVGFRAAHLKAAVARYGL